MSHPPSSADARRRAALARWLALALETHISLPLFALLLLAALWGGTFHAIDADRKATLAAARAASSELADTYEAQLARSVAGIDQTLRVLKYAVEQHGPSGALATLRRQELLPSGLVFVVAVADRNGMVVASNPATGPLDVSAQRYFTAHRERDSGAAFVSDTIGDPTRPEPHLHFTRRINDAHGGFAGVAIVEADPGYFTSAYEHGREGEHGILALAGNDGLVRALRVGDKVSWGQRIALARLPENGAAPAANLPDGVPRFAGLRRLHGLALTAVAGVSVAEQLQPHQRRRRAYLTAAAGASALLAVVVALISGWSWQLARARRRARRAQDTYAAASEASTDAFFVLRTVRAADGSVHDFEIDELNSRAEQMTGMTRKQARGRLLCAMMPSYRENGIFEGLVQVADEGGVHEAEWLGVTDPVRGRWLQRQVVPVEGGVVAIVRDITERKLAEERIHHMAHHDELTGLPNRVLARDRLDLAIAEAGRTRGALAFAFVDLDGFKLVNDCLGHNAGDELLRVVSARMRDCLRAIDTLGRFGGDEFVIVLPALADNPLAIAPTLERLRQAVTEPVLVAGQMVQVSCSIGVAMYPRDGLDPCALMMNADAAMYRAKEQGKNNFQFYAREMNDRVEEKLVLLDGLRKAIDSLAGGHGEPQFSLLYQPKVDLANGRIFGVEALIRWHHPEHGLVPPQRFIGLAEESGLIVAIGEWVVQSACRQNQAWRAAGLEPITISVNVSPRQFEEQQLVERVAHALQHSGLDPAGLELEVTESLIMRDLARSVGKMRELKAMGISLSIDDFGTGYSSLSALKTFPISRLKIDKSFVSDLADSVDDQAIALAVISLGHRLHLRVIAEGVETAQQRDFLRAHGCDEMQGYLFSRPVPAPAIAALLAAQHGQLEEQRRWA
jgi:diguanylate cyclase (GGDEF)-like protein/PAS domain S-box-containing protein